MSSKFLLAFLTAACVTTVGLSGSAQAQKQPVTDAVNLNSSKSNAYRESPDKTCYPDKGKAKQSATGGSAEAQMFNPKEYRVRSSDKAKKLDSPAAPVECPKK